MFMEAPSIEKALREATDQQIASENGRRTQAKRKVKTGGRNGGRPKKIAAIHLAITPLKSLI